MTDNPLQGTDEPLTSLYDAALFDLDGVLYVGTEPVEHAADGVRAARDAGMRIGFVTNNASRSADSVAALLIDVGVPARPDEVVTSGQAAARLLADTLPAGSAVLITGTRALADEVAAVGLRPVGDAAENPAAVVQGYGPDVGWRLLAESTAAARNGARWVVTNADLTVPSPRGPMPGNGALVNAVELALGRPPDEIVGKPHGRLHAESLRRIGGDRPLVVGDRLDTDVEGANNAGSASLLVLTGVTDAAGLLAARPDRRPTYLAADLRGLSQPQPYVRISGGNVDCGGWTMDGGVLAGDGPDDVDALRVLAVAAWRGDGASFRADGDAAAGVLERLGLAGR